jgi:crotonobetainyl-CoA:carnitine CoA-transferase CaiB-like acyl-CoA transferase
MLAATPPTGPLLGLRVLDLTHLLSGPYCSMVLADLGADVVKVEPLNGELIRTVGRAGSDTQQFGPYFQSINRGKRSIAIDLRRPEGREVLLRLAEHADALLENFRSNVMDKLGLGFETLHEINPRLVYGCVRGFGDHRTGEGPLLDWPGYDIVAQAMGGLTELTGAADGPPRQTGAAVGDIFPGTLLATGVLAAVMSVRAGGVGQLVDVAMYDSVVALCERSVYQYSSTGQAPTRIGNAHPMFEPFGLFECDDGWVAMAAPCEPYWSELCGLVDIPDLAYDARFATTSDRREYGADLQRMLAPWFARRRVADVVELFGGRVPVGPVNTAADIYADPQLAAREMLVALEHPGQCEPTTVAGCPIKFTETPALVARRAPLLGEHTAAILAEAGYVRAEADALYADDVVR